jgi:hypothetical protein
LKAKEDQGGFVRNPLSLLNFSTRDLATCILRFAFEEMGKEQHLPIGENSQ